MEWWLSDPTGLSSSAPGAGMPDVGLQCFLDAPLPVSGQLHRRQGGLGTRTQGHWGLPLALRGYTGCLDHNTLRALAQLPLTTFCTPSLAP